MTEFPTILYRVPGPWPAKGFSFATLPAKDQAEYDAAVSDGWHPSVPAAEEAWRNPVAVVVRPELVPALDPVPDDNAPPTRAEIEQKAKELGIAVHHKHSDATLLKKIEDALKEPAGDVDQA